MALKLDSRGGMSASRSPHTTYRRLRNNWTLGAFGLVVSKCRLTPELRKLRLPSSR